MGNEFWLGFVGLFISIITSAVLITRSLSKENTALTQLVYRKFNEAKSDIDDESDKLRIEFGETVKALKKHVELYEEKLYKVELYIRDNYISDPTFGIVVKDIKDDMKALKDDIKDLSEKLDKLISHPIKIARN